MMLKAQMYAFIRLTQVGCAGEEGSTIWIFQPQCFFPRRGRLNGRSVTMQTGFHI